MSCLTLIVNERFCIDIENVSENQYDAASFTELMGVSKTTTTITKYPLPLLKIEHLENDIFWLCYPDDTVHLYIDVTGIRSLQNQIETWISSQEKQDSKPEEEEDAEENNEEKTEDKDDTTEE
jgi:hypothetical protein